jgi:hypothetical protein
MVATDPEDTPQTIEEFRDRGNITPLPWTIDQSGEISRASGANALETTVILDREGETVYRDATSTDYEDLERELEEVL